MAPIWTRNPVSVRRLRRGDRVAIISPSSGLAPLFPGVYERGLEALRSIGLEPIEFQTARMSSEELYAEPRLRARDLEAALVDPNIAGIVATIGGYESIRLYPHFREETFAGHPKLLLGGSDATTYTLYARRAGTVAFYGPSVMAGFSQMDDLPDSFRQHCEQFLFEPWERYEYRPYEAFTHGYTGWAKEGKGGVQALKKSAEGWTLLQGAEPEEGRLWGGCIEVVEFLKGTRYWPPIGFFDDVVLFFETSEEKPSPDRVGYMLRNYGVAGILKRVRGMVFGRAKDYSDEETKRLHELVKRIVSEEWDRPDLPILMDVNVGHTDPKLIFPVGGRVRLVPERRSITLLETPFRD